MEINNINLIKPLLSWDDPNDFYFIQILKRKKENNDCTSNSKIIKYYYISSAEHLLDKFEEMKILSKFHKARIYINLNRRNFEHLSLLMLKKVTDCLINKAYKDLSKAYDSVCGMFQVEKDKKWVVDLDDDHHKSDNKYFIIDLIKETGGTIYTEIPTINGIHLITSPFNTQVFNENMFWEKNNLNYPEIHKNNPTLLYYSDDKI